MAIKLITFLSFALQLSTVLSNVLTTGAIDQWCAKTPYPEACKTNFHQKLIYVPKNMSDFKTLTIRATMETAVEAQSYNKWIGQKCRTEKQKAAWSDCLNLYQETIDLLNQTLNPCTVFDSQTWISASLTNLETCRTGLFELGIPENELPLMSNNVTKLISNTLSMFNGSNDTPLVTDQYEEGFPTWVKSGDRRLLQSSSAADAVVAQDGSGNYFKSIKEALDAATNRSGTSNRFVIRVKSGVYNENLVIELENIYLIGDGLNSTIITGNRSVAGGYTTFNSATVAVTGRGFMARDITFRNTAGPENHQAVALRSSADFSVFYRCGIEGYQDTLYAHSKRQFYKKCDVYGTIDFIFGNAAVVLQNCKIYSRKPMINQRNMITAQSRTDPNQNTGISIHNSRVMASWDLEPVIGSVETYLGRPWKEYSRTVFLQTHLDSLISPAGWFKWKGDFALSTLYYGEYNNTGPGSETGGRVQWSGYNVINSSSTASTFTVANFIAGNSWLPATGVPFTSGL